MKDAISVFIGEHDFRSSISSEDKRENSVRNITDASIDVKDSIVEGETLIKDTTVGTEIGNISKEDKDKLQFIV